MWNHLPIMFEDSLAHFIAFILDTTNHVANTHQHQLGTVEHMPQYNMTRYCAGFRYTFLCPQRVCCLLHPLLLNVMHGSLIRVPN